MSYTKTAILPVTPDEAFALITDPERLRRWQTVTAYVDLRAGGDYRWTVTPGHVAAGTYREVEPGRRLVFGFGWEGSDDLPPDASTVTFVVEPVEGGCQVTLTHEGLSEEQAAHARRGLEPLPGAHGAPRELGRRRSGRVGLRAGDADARDGRPGRARRDPADAAQPHPGRPAQAVPLLGVHRARPRRAPDGRPGPAGRHGRRHRGQPRGGVAGEPGVGDGGPGHRRLARRSTSTAPSRPATARCPPASPPTSCPSSSPCTAGTWRRRAGSGCTSPTSWWPTSGSSRRSSCPAAVREAPSPPRWSPRPTPLPWTGWPPSRGVRRSVPDPTKPLGEVHHTTTKE